MVANNGNNEGLFRAAFMESGSPTAVYTFRLLLSTMTDIFTGRQSHGRTAILRLSRQPNELYISAGHPGMPSEGPLRFAEDSRR